MFLIIDQLEHILEDRIRQWASNNNNDDIHIIPEKEAPDICRRHSYLIDDVHKANNINNVGSKKRCISLDYIIDTQKSDNTEKNDNDEESYYMDSNETKLAILKEKICIALQ